MRLSPWLVGTLLFVVVIQTACSKSDPMPNPSLREEALKVATLSCNDFVKKLQADFANVPGAFYDFITVPEDPTNPHGRQIKVFYYGRTVPGQIPVAFFNGGPAGNSHSSYTILVQQQKQEDAWAKIPFIFIDQRGTGCSDPYPQGSTDETLQRLVNYGTRGIIADAEAIRQKLGLRQWKIYGQSYGAFLIHRYYVLAPQSIVSAHAHAGVITSDPLQRLIGRIHSQNRAIETFLGDFPSDREVLKTLNTSLNPKMCFSHAGFSYDVCGLDVFNPLLAQLGFTDTWQKLHLRFNLMVDGSNLNTVHTQELMDRLVFVPAEKGRSSGVASSVIGWNDRNVIPEDHANCQKVYDALRAQGEKPETWLFNECVAALQQPPEATNPLEDRIRQLPQDMLTIADFKIALTAHPTVPFFLYSGQKDAYVPVEDFQEELGQVSSLVRYTNFAGTGHDGFYTEPKVWEELLK